MRPNEDELDPLEATGWYTLRKAARWLTQHGYPMTYESLHQLASQPLKDGRERFPHSIKIAGRRYIPLCDLEEYTRTPKGGWPKGKKRKPDNANS